MRRQRSILLFLLLAAAPVLAQDTTAGVFHVTNISKEGLTLDQGWKFSAGDNPEWAKPDFEDKAWLSISPTIELHNLPELKQSGIGWFRLKLDVDSSLLGESLSMAITNMGASEIYLNGQLIYKIGIVSKDYKEELTRFFVNQLYSLKLGKNSSQTIAIRYSFNKKNLYLKFSFKRPLVRIILKNNNQAFIDHIKEDSFESTLRTIQVSFYLPLGFLLFFLFISFRLRREYLYAGISCFCLFAAILLHILAETETTTVTRTNLLLLITQIFYILGALALIHSIYILYNQKRNWFYYLLVLYGLLIIPFFFISYDSSGLFNACFFPVINIEFLRLNILAVRRCRPGAWTLLCTSILFALAILSYIILNYLGKDDLSTLSVTVSYITLGLGLSLFYAGEFARTASSLNMRIVEVEQLSEKMIAQEKEKQQILSSQNETLEKQVTERTAALSQSLKELKETQEQLIQREKMASLGELTAGIAHEIQNPLNFVNNFSEVNKELLEEMKEEIDKGKTDEAKIIADDVIYNQEKITEHGKRADAIVKGMLYHSRSSNSVKESTDINKLADEYLRLAYHGLRAKDKSFNATMKTDYDETIGNIIIVPQDIGRVILNLITNAFYAVDEKKKSSFAEATEDKYEPTVLVSTKKISDKVLISVKDNGNGIPQKVLDKIFLPFFTTKPTGQGTGLGLSMSYDIVIAHGGELKVETKEGEGAEFIIQLPA